MATEVTRFAAGTAATTSAGVVLVTGSDKGIITNIVLSNKTATTRTATVLINSISFCTGLQIPANGTVNFDTRTVVLPTELLQVTADVASSVDYFVSGVVVSP